MHSVKPLVIMVAALASNAWAINKCTSADGKVSYQEAPCAATARGQEISSAPPSAMEASKQLQFERSVDAMTNTKTCAAVSPAMLAVGRNYRDINDARLIVLALPEGKFRASVQIFRGSLIHNDLSGMGIKSDPGSFLPLDVKGGQRVVSTSASGQVIDELVAARSVRLRLRFWPYDDLIDTEPAAMTGFRQAVTLAASCAKSG